MSKELFLSYQKPLWSCLDPFLHQDSQMQISKFITFHFFSFFRVNYFFCKYSLSHEPFLSNLKSILYRKGRISAWSVLFPFTSFQNFESGDGNFFPPSSPSPCCSLSSFLFLPSFSFTHEKHYCVHNKIIFNNQVLFVGFQRACYFLMLNGMLILGENMLNR